VPIELDQHAVGLGLAIEVAGVAVNVLRARMKAT